MPKLRISDQEQFVVNYLQNMRDLVLREYNNSWIPPNDQIRFEFTGLPSQEFRRAFPRCQTIDSVLDGFHVKKFYFPAERKTVTYIASRCQIPEPFIIHTQTAMIQYVKGFGNNYISQASCSNGQITYIEYGIKFLLASYNQNDESQLLNYIYVYYLSAKKP